MILYSYKSIFCLFLLSSITIILQITPSNIYCTSWEKIDKTLPFFTSYTAFISNIVPKKDYLWRRYLTKSRVGTRYHVLTLEAAFPNKHNTYKSKKQSRIATDRWCERKCCNKTTIDTIHEQRGRIKVWKRWDNVLLTLV